MFVVAYAMMAATFGTLIVASNYDDNIEDPIDDETRHAFDDWFKDAAVDNNPEFVKPEALVDSTEPHPPKDSSEDEEIEMDA